MRNLLIILILTLGSLCGWLFSSNLHQQTQINNQENEIVKDTTFIQSLGICTFNNGYKVYVSDSTCENLTKAFQSNYQAQTRPMTMCYTDYYTGITACR